MRTGNILVALFGSGLALSLLWLQTVPLGIPGEWTWDRLKTEPDLGWNLGSGLVAAAIFLAFVSPWIAIAIYVGNALYWLVPDRRIERALARHKA